ncbi:MAG: phenylacetate--CoA ligase family protein [Acidimicrobiales bacterium]|nr:phenylacetate--CoA ligase family protein [Acidimicrobiales bacterium]
MSVVDRAAPLYRHLPVSWRGAAASAQGLRLRAWRYGPGAEALVEVVLARDRWSEDRWRTWLAGREAAVLAHAAAHVPRHRRWFAEHPDRDPGDLGEWPVLTKAEAGAEPSALLADDAPRRRYRDQTSGTSGTPLPVWTSRRDLRAFFALHEARTRRWHGVSRHDRWAILGGQLVVPAERDRPPYWVRNRGLGQLYLSTHNLRPATVADYARALAAFAPTHLVVYPSAATEWARLALEAGVALTGPRVLIANAEGVTPGQRSLLEEAFGCPVRETYGMAEMAAGASECEAGTLHLWPECGRVEVLGDDDAPVGPGEAGRLVLTGLANDTTSFVRYANGDRGRPPVWGSDCPCGSTLPTLPPVEGRDQDLVRTPAGGRQFWFNPVFYGLPVVEAQIVQDRLDRVRAVVVPGPGFDDATARLVGSRLRERLPGVDVAVERRAAIERGPTGKFRPVVSRLGPGGSDPD